MKTLLSDMKRLCTVELYPGFLTPGAASQAFFASLAADFQADKVNMYGREIVTKRRTIGYGDKGVTYKYTGADRPANPWPEFVGPIKSRIESTLSKIRPVTYNYMLSTLYLDGSAGLGYHADDEPEIDQSVPIACLSLGAGRDFLVRDKETRQVCVKVCVNAGDLLVMRGHTQTYYQHSIPERASRGNTRVSWTFRAIRT